MKEVSKYEALNIGSKSKIRIIPEQDLTFNIDEVRPQTVGMKPEGMWYGVGTSWIEWVESEMPEKAHDNVFKLDIDESKVLLIDDYSKFDVFEKEYSTDLLEVLGVNSLLGRIGFNNMIDWKKVSEKWSGIEISPYLYKYRLQKFWYYGWDCASGVIWKPDAIKKITKLTESKELIL